LADQIASQLARGIHALGRVSEFRIVLFQHVDEITQHHLRRETLP
jgi:hypothetical protein